MWKQDIDRMLFCIWKGDTPCAEPLRVPQLIAVLRWRDMVIDPECFAEIVVIGVA